MPHDLRIVGRGDLEAEPGRSGRCDLRNDVVLGIPEAGLDKFPKSGCVTAGIEGVHPELLSRSQVFGGGDDLGHPSLATLMNEDPVRSCSKDPDNEDGYEQLEERYSSLVTPPGTGLQQRASALSRPVSGCFEPPPRMGY